MGNDEEGAQSGKPISDARVSIDAVNLDDVDYAILVVINDRPLNLILVLKSGSAISVFPAADAIKKLRDREISIKIVNVSDPALDLVEGKVEWPEVPDAKTKRRPVV